LWTENDSYVLPIASTSTLGGIKVGNNLSIDSTTGILDATDTTYSDVTTSNHGLMTASDKIKLNSIAIGANSVSVSATGTSTDTVSYITIDGVEKKLASGGGGGADPIIEDTDPVKHLSDLSSISLGWKEDEIGVSWDGDTTGKTMVAWDENINLYKVSDISPIEDLSYLLNTNMTSVVNDEIYTFTIKLEEDAGEDDAVLWDYTSTFPGVWGIFDQIGNLIIYITYPNTFLMGIVFVEAGIYFSKYIEEDEGTTYIIYPSYVAFDMTNYHQINSRYIPNMLPQVVENISDSYYTTHKELSTTTNHVLYGPWSNHEDDVVYAWNGDTTLPSFAYGNYTFYRIADSCSIDSFLKGWHSMVLYGTSENSGRYRDWSNDDGDITCVGIGAFGSGGYLAYNATEETYVSYLGHAVAEGLWVLGESAYNISITIPTIHLLSTRYIEGLANYIEPGLVKVDYSPELKYSEPVVIDNDGFLWSTSIVSGLTYSTTVPTSDNKDGLKIVVLNAEPTTRYNGWLYIITG